MRLAGGDVFYSVMMQHVFFYKKLEGICEARNCSGSYKLFRFFVRRQSMNSHTVEHHCDNKKIYDMLKYLSENDKLDIQQIQNVYDMTKKQELLNRHIYSIWQGKNDNKFYTYLPDDTKKRILVKRNTEEEIQNVVINYWKEQELNPTLQEVFDEWNDRRLELKKISASTHVRYIALFQKHFGDIKDKKIRNTDTEFLLKFYI